MRRLTLLLLGLLLLAAPAHAQNRPLSASTFTTTDTSADSLHVGCAIGSSTCTGGIKAGPGSFSTLTTSNTGASSLDVAGGINAGTGNVQIVGTDGRIPDISSTTFASLSGANLTSIPETAITNGTILARVADNEVITGTWNFPAMFTLGGTGKSLFAANALAASAYNGVAVASNIADESGSGGTRGAQSVTTVPSWAIDVGGRYGGDGAPWLADSFAVLRRPAAGSWASVAQLGSTGNWTITGQFLGPTGLGPTVPVYSFSGDTNTGLAYTGSDAFVAIAGGTSIESWSSSVGVSINHALVLPNAISQTLASGNTNDWNPASLAPSFLLRVTADVSGSTLTGIAAQPAGTVKMLCKVAGGTFTIAHDSTLSGTAANRILVSGSVDSGINTNQCVLFIYDGTSSRWRLNF